MFFQSVPFLRLAREKGPPIFSVSPISESKVQSFSPRESTLWPSGPLAVWPFGRRRRPPSPGAAEVLCDLRPRLRRAAQAAAAAGIPDPPRESNRTGRVEIGALPSAFLAFLCFREPAWHQLLRFVIGCFVHFGEEGPSFGGVQPAGRTQLATWHPPHFECSPLEGGRVFPFSGHYFWKHELLQVLIFEA